MKDEIGKTLGELEAEDAAGAGVVAAQAVREDPQLSRTVRRAVGKQQHLKYKLALAEAFGAEFTRRLKDVEDIIEEWADDTTDDPAAKMVLSYSAAEHLIKATRRVETPADDLVQDTLDTLAKQFTDRIAKGFDQMRAAEMVWNIHRSKKKK